MLLPHVRIAVPGFREMEAELTSWLNRQYDTVVELIFAHGLRQGPDTLRSTGFDVHQDTEDYDFIQFTVVVKLTADDEGEPASRSTLRPPVRVQTQTICYALSPVPTARIARTVTWPA